MLKNKKSLLVVTLLLVAVLLAACGSKASIEGKWQPDGTNPMAAEVIESFGIDPAEYVTEFTKDGKMVTSIAGKSVVEAMKESMIKSGLATEETIGAMTIDEPVMTYKVDGDKITLSMTMAGTTQDTTGTFKVDGDKLTITADGQTSTFKRVK